MIVPAKRDTITERWETFHAANPWVLYKLVEMTEQLYKQGRKKIGIKMLWEVIRWHVAVGTITVDDDFKFNNNYHSRYVREIAKRFPKYAGMFNLRELRSE